MKKDTNRLYCRVATLMVILAIPLWLQAASTIQFTANTYKVGESAGAASITIQRTSDTNTEVAVDYATIDGTATNGLKYTAVSGTLAFGSGQTNKTITVPILDNGLVEGTKTFQVLLSNPTGTALLGTRTNATVSITDNDVGIQFHLSTYSVAEDAGVLLLGIVRGDNGTNAVTVDLATANLTATNGQDYIGITNTLSFAAEERLKVVPIAILNNILKQTNRTFRASLTNPVRASLGNQKATTVVIMDNDQGFALEFASYSVAEDAGTARINVLRGTDATNSSVAVDFATTDLSATNGLDYIDITNTLSFAPGEKVRVITVPILNDGVKEATRNFRLTLNNPSSGSVLGSRTTTTVSILDNDPGVGFERTQYTSAWQDAREIPLTVLRGNDWDLGLITVDYATSDLTAKAGKDYQALSGTLQFRENETARSLMIPILRDRTVAGTVNFKVTLTNATGGAALGTSSATVNIVGAYSTVAPPFETALTIEAVEGLNAITWAGGGALQMTGVLPDPWQTLTSVRSPITVQSPHPAAFYRVALPRPANLYIPSGYDGQTPLPLVLSLHGFSDEPTEFGDPSGLTPLAELRRFLFCYPVGTTNALGAHFWNATDACCDFLGQNVDDAGYLRSLIETIEQNFVVDPKRVFLTGPSNGGFMAYRMACQHADLIAAIASRFGATFLDTDDCIPSQPVNVLHIHGTDDSVVLYGGGSLGIALGFPANMPPFPSVLGTVQTWARYNGCENPITENGPSLDLDADVPGLDTVVTRYSHCPPGGAVELWTVIGGQHGWTRTSDFSQRVIDWLLAHPKP